MLGYLIEERGALLETQMLGSWRLGILESQRPGCLEALAGVGGGGGGLRGPTGPAVGPTGNSDARILEAWLAGDPTLACGGAGVEVKGRTY